MARRTLTTALILSYCLTFIQAESTYGIDKGNSNGDSIQKPEPLGQLPAAIALQRNADFQLRLTPDSRVGRTLGANSDASKPKPAVPLNSTGVDASYRGRRSSRSGAANRLRGIRKRELLPAQTHGRDDRGENSELFDGPHLHSALDSPQL